VRSRLVRLIPYAPPSSPLDAIRRLLEHRLSPQSSAREARDEWRDIVEGRSKLWKGIPSDRKETIRGKSRFNFHCKVADVVLGFLVYFESELLKRAHKKFDFRNGRYVLWIRHPCSVSYIHNHSIGNYFLAAAQGFFRSLPSAIFLFSSITNSQVCGVYPE
jgi:hypothetical protein